MTDLLDHWLPALMSISSSTVNDSIWEWASPINRERFKRWYVRLDRIIEWKSKRKGKLAVVDRGRRSRVLGRVSEHLLRILFQSGGALTVQGNVRSTTNEIDLLLKVEPLAKFLPVLSGAGTHIIGEAKCHKKPPSSELVNEFVGFLQVQNTKFGILFVFSASQQLKSACRNGIAMHWKDGWTIVPIGRKQLQQVLDGVPFLRVLSDQHLDAKNHLVRLSI